MKLLYILALVFSGCATTTFYGANGKPIARMQGDMTGVQFASGNTSFSAVSVNHSAATRAGGDATAKVLQSAGTMAVGIGAAVAGGAKP